MAAISFGEVSSTVEPEVSEWGNPTDGNISDPMLSEVGIRKHTQGIETS